MKRTAIAIAVTVLSGALVAGTATAASAADGSRSGGAEGVVTIFKSAIDIVGALNGPAVNTDVTVKNDTGYPIEIVGMSPPYKMQVTAPASGTVIPSGQAFQLGMSVERDSGGRVDRDAGVSVVYRPITGWTGTGFISPYSKNGQRLAAGGAVEQEQADLRPTAGPDRQSNRLPRSSSRNYGRLRNAREDRWP